MLTKSPIQISLLPFGLIILVGFLLGQASNTAPSTISSDLQKRRAQLLHHPGEAVDGFKTQVEQIPGIFDSKTFKHPRILGGYMGHESYYSTSWDFPRSKAFGAWALDEEAKHQHVIGLLEVPIETSSVWEVLNSSSVGSPKFLS